MPSSTFTGDITGYAVSEMATMSAVTFKQYGDYQMLERTAGVPRPQPKADEVLIEVAASSLNRGDWHYVHGYPFPLRLMAGGLCTPKRNVPGVDAVGTIVAVGAEVSRFNVGDRVLADLSNSGFGGWAEFVTSKAVHISHCPAELNDELAATIPISGVTALQGLRDHAQLQSGERVLVNGATGGVGMYAALIASRLGADVTVVGSSSKAAFLNQLGAQRVIYYDSTDLMSSGEQYDVIVDAAAYRPFYQMKNLLTDNGRYLMVGGSMANFARISLLGPLLSRKNGRRYLSFLQAASADDMQTIAAWMVSGQLVLPTPQVLPMHQASEAMRMMEQRELSGKVCLQMTSAG